MAAGGPEVLRTVELPVVEPREGQVRIRVHHAAINPTDIGLRNAGARGGVSGDPPWVPGMDAAGLVDSAPGSGDLVVGDRVMAIVVPFGRRLGAQAEYVVVPRESVVPVPDGMDLTAASTLPMNAMTAHYALTELDLPRGSTLAITGGAGVLASYLIPMARHRGLQVIADAAPDDVELVRGFGANHLVERGDDFAVRVREVRPNGVDAVADAAVLGAPVLAAVRDGGQVIAVREWTGHQERDIRIRPILVGYYAKNQQALLDIRDLAERGVLQPRVAGVYDLDQAADAYRRFEAGGVRGRLVIRLVR